VTSFVGSWYYDEQGQHVVTPSLVVPGEYVVWDVGSLDNGYGGRMDIVLEVDANASSGTLLTHTVQITSLPVEDDFDDNAIAWVDMLNDYGPNLRLEKRAYWNWDGEIGYELRVINLGTTALDNFWITDTYPLSTSFNGNWWVNHGGWYTLTEDAANGRLIFWGDYLDAGSTASLGFNINLDAPIVGQPGLYFTNLAESPVVGDVYPQDNTSAATLFSGPDLFIEKTLAAGDVRPGELITYNLRFGNGQQGHVWWWGMQGDAVITDTLPENTQFVSSELLYCGSEAWCTYDPFTVTGSQVMWNVGQLGAFNHNELRVTVLVTGSLSGLDVLTNTAEMYSSRPDLDIEPDYANNVASLATGVDLPYFTIGKAYAQSGSGDASRTRWMSATWAMAWAAACG
jgi:hypothetical protein